MHAYVSVYGLNTFKCYIIGEYFNVKLIRFSRVFFMHTLYLHFFWYVSSKDFYPNLIVHQQDKQ